MTRYRIAPLDEEDNAPVYRKYRRAPEENESSEEFNFFKSSPQDQQNTISQLSQLQDFLKTLPGYGQDVLSGVEKSGENIAKFFFGNKVPTSNLLERPNKSPFAEEIGKNLPYMIAGGMNLPGQILSQGLYGAFNAEPGNRLTEAAKQAAITGGLGAAGKGLMLAPKVISKIPSAFDKAMQDYALSGESRNLSEIKNSIIPEEVAENARVAEGTNTPLHAILGSPSMQKKFENVLMPKLKSVVTEPLKNLKTQIYNKGEDLLNKIGGVSDLESAPEAFVDALKGLKQESNQVKNELYSTVDDVAKQAGFNADLKNTLNTSKKLLEEIYNTDMLSHKPAVQNIINKIISNVERAKPNKIDLGSYAQIAASGAREPISYKELRLLKREIHDIAERERQFPAMQNRNMAAKLFELERSLSSDLEHSVNKTGSEELKQAIKNADAYYGDKYSKFLDKDLYKYTSGKENPNKLFKEFLGQGGVFDKNLKLEKLDKFLSPEQKQSMLNYKLRSAAYKKGEFNPLDLSKEINKIRSNKQMADILMPDQEQKQALLDWKRLHDINKTAMNINFNPHTDVRGLEMAAEHDPLAMAASIAMQSKGLGPALMSLGSHLLTRTTNRKKALFEAERMLSEEHRKRILGDILNRGTE